MFCQFDSARTKENIPRPRLPQWIRTYPLSKPIFPTSGDFQRNLPNYSSRVYLWSDPQKIATKGFIALTA